MSEAWDVCGTRGEAPPLSRRTFMLGATGIVVASMVGWSSPHTNPAAAASDVIVEFDAATNSWTLGTAAITKKISLVGGVFRMTSLVSNAGTTDFVGGASNSQEFLFTWNGTVLGGGSGGWGLQAQSSQNQPDGSVRLDLVLVRSGLTVTRSYTVYPETGVIAERTIIHNVSGSASTLTNPAFLTHSLLGGAVAGTTLSYMTGGGNFTGSGILKEVPLTSSYSRAFDSHDQAEIIEVDGHTTPGLGSYSNGTSIYDTFFALENVATKDRLWFTFDYNGHWVSQIVSQTTGLSAVVQSYTPALSIPANGSIELPLVTLGVASGDVDDLGNAIGDYTYRYLWDYTRSIVPSGGWQWRSAPQLPNAVASANYTRYIGAGLVHIDDNWYDRKGDWKPALASDDITALSSYVRKSGIQLKMWMPFWHIDRGSEVLDAHPNWLVNGSSATFYGLHLDLANGDAAAWARAKADAAQADWGGYRWRYDGMPSWPAGGDESTMLLQSQAFLGLLKSVKDGHSDATIDGCASGGETLLMGAVRFSDSQQTTDGNAHHYSGYYQSLKLPIDKISHTFASEPSIATGFSQVTQYSESVAESTRKYIALQRWLTDQGMVGRWVKVYRPPVVGGDHTYVLQRSSGDQKRSYLTFSSYTPYFGSAVTVHPKGLLPTHSYALRMWKTPGFAQTKTGAQWMTDGVPIAALKEGEILLFNLTDYPGSGQQTTAPAAPTAATKTLSNYLGASGTEINWTMASATSWVSYVEIVKNGAVIDKVSRGTFWFGAGHGSDASYAVRAVTGDEVRSSATAVPLASGGVSGPASPPPVVPTTTQLATAFALTQGANNWAYLQRDRRSSSTLYLTNMKADSTNNRWVGDEPYTLAFAGALSPQAPHDAVVKWFAPKAGRVRVSGKASLAQPGQGGDGTTLTIAAGGEVPSYLGDVLWGPQAMPGDSSAEVGFDLERDVNAGDAIYFIAAQNDDHYFDVTNWDPKIEYV
ncbi:hypothetical protein G4G29_16745 [Microbacterium sp. Se63.02b]|nr:hypothetical protein G4G29_16745 [Microbacterium sp. Se63.02b]